MRKQSLSAHYLAMKCNQLRCRVLGIESLRDNNSVNPAELLLEYWEGPNNDGRIKPASIRDHDCHCYSSRLPDLSYFRSLLSLKMQPRLLPQCASLDHETALKSGAS